MDNRYLEPMVDPIALARRRNCRSLLASSYDRRGGNHDWSSYIRTEGGAAVLMDAVGPGCITRFWTADPRQGIVRIFIDGHPRPAIEMSLSKLFDLLPLSFGIGGESTENYARSGAERLPMGHTSYCPIPFERSCKVTIDPEDDYLYYQINYQLYPPGAAVRSFDQATHLDTGEVRAASAAWLAWEQGTQPAAWDPNRHTVYTLHAGAETELLNADGAGIVRGIRVALPICADPATAAHVRDNLWLVAHFDDDEPRDPSVRAPIGPMCLDYGHPIRPRTLYVGSEADGAYYIRFAMPFRHSARVRLINRSIVPLEGLTTDVVSESLPELPDDLHRFRATWHIESPFGPDHRDYGGAACRILNLDGRDNYELLNVRGAGHFVGCGFHVDLREAPTDRAAGEGDEMFFVDDDPRLTMYGTGTEDYVNDAWGIRGYGGPLSGSGIAGAWGVDPQLFGYRLHTSDCVPFVRKGRFTLEHGTGNNCSGLCRSVAYWYQSPEANRVKSEEARWEAIRNR